MKKIYFCGSIRGGRQDAELYFRMIAKMKQRFAVLTEHIGSPELFGMESNKSDAAIWKEDTDWLRESDFVVAEASTASLGVGYELYMAQTLQKPTYVFYRSADKKSGLSAMIAGDPYYRLYPYSSEEELFALLQEVMDEQA